MKILNYLEIASTTNGNKYNHSYNKIVSNSMKMYFI